MINKFLLGAFSNMEVADCESKCVEKFDCKSVNTENSGAKTCQLISKSTENVDDGQPLLTAKTGWTYRATDYKTLLLGELCQDLNPCGSLVFCRDTCTCPGYECINYGIVAEPTAAASVGT